MIQRPQTVFLFLTAALLIYSLFVPVWISPATDGVSKVVVTPFNFIRYNGEEMVSKTWDYAYLGAMVLVVAIASLFSISQFKNRILQMKIGMGISLALTVYIVLIFLVTSKINTSTKGSQGSYAMGFFLVAGAVICNIISNRLIKRDEDMVRESDRIR